MPTHCATVFSILIPSVPSRVVTHLLPLFAKLQGQLAAYPDGAKLVEIVCLLDNKKRSIGLKREALVQCARGDWMAFVDDDDDVSDDYIQKIVDAIGEIFHSPRIEWPEVIVFDQQTTIDDGPPRLVQHSIEHDNTELTEEGCFRKPWHHNVWWTELAKTAHFPDASYGEDAAWLKQLWPQVKKQHRIDGPPLHYYRFNNAVTEAEHTFPPEAP